MLDRMMADNGFPGPVAESEGCRVFQFHSETGEGSMTQYDPVSYTHLTLPTICSV